MEADNALGGATEPNPARFERFFARSLDLFLIAGFDGRFIDLNPAWEATLGYPLEELKQRPFLDLVHPDDRDHTLREFGVLTKGGETIWFENRYRHRDGSYRWLLWSGVPDPEDGLIYGSARDVTDRKADEQEAEHFRELSLRDELTGLLNRRGFLTVSDHDLRLARREQRELTLLFIDLDGLKDINDRFGHHAGDAVLRETGEVLRSSLRESDVIARVGGDEFCVVLEGGAPAEAAARRRIEEAVAERNRRARRPYALALSIGAIPFGVGDVVDLEALMRQADRRMYRAKRRRR